jgi:hypothetical protein
MEVNQIMLPRKNMNVGAQPTTRKHKLLGIESKIVEVSNISCRRLDCLYRCVIKYHKAACTVFLMISTWLFETCRGPYN